MLSLWNFLLGIVVWLKLAWSIAPYTAYCGRIVPGRGTASCTIKPDSVSEREVQASTRLAEAVEAQLGNKVFAALLPAACEMPFRRQSKASGVLDLEKCSL